MDYRHPRTDSRRHGRIAGCSVRRGLAGGGHCATDGRSRSQKTDRSGGPRQSDRKIQSAEECRDVLPVSSANIWRMRHDGAHCHWRDGSFTGAAGFGRVARAEYRWDAARRVRAKRVRTTTNPVIARQIAVVVPAHNESANIARAVSSLLRADCGNLRPAIVVVADNCADDTAEAAARAGARVLVRFNDILRGKGYALDYAFETAAS